MAGHRRPPLLYLCLLFLSATLLSCSAFSIESEETHPRLPRRQLPEDAVVIQQNYEHPSPAEVNLHGPVLPQQIPSTSPIRGAIKERLQAAAHEFETTLPQLLLSEESCTSTLSAQSKVLGPFHGLITVRIDFLENMCGTLHPLSWTDTFVVDLSTRLPLSLEQVFDRKATDLLPELSELASELLLEKYPELDSSWIGRGTSPVAENFSSFLVQGDGIVLLFKDYQVAPHAAGVRELFVPIEALKPLLGTESPLIPLFRQPRRQIGDSRQAKLP